MPSFKKLITSGSDAQLNSVTIPNVTINSTGIVVTGSVTISGSNTFKNYGPAIFEGTSSFNGPTNINGTLTANLIKGTASFATTSSYALNVGSVSGYNFTQTSPSTTWTINHNLGTQTPIITVYDSNYDVVIPNTITNTDTNTTIIGFTYSTTGYATISSGDGVSRNNIGTSSYALYALTASYALNGGGGGSAQMTITASQNNYYISCQGLTTTTIPATGQYWKPNAPSTSNGITYDVSTGIFTLEGGRTYEFDANFVGNDTGECQWQWFDITNNVNFGYLGVASNVWLYSPAKTIYTPPTNCQVALVSGYINYNQGMRADIGYVTIEEVNADVTGIITGNFLATASVAFAETASYALNTKATYGFITQSGQILVNGGNINSPNQTLLTLAIPSAGVWKIDAAINCGVSLNLTMGVALYRPGGTLVAGTGNEISNQAGGYFYSAMPLFAIVETTSSANYTLRAWSNGVTDSMTSAGGKTTYAYWTKIG